MFALVATPDTLQDALQPSLAIKIIPLIGFERIFYVFIPKKLIFFIPNFSLFEFFPSSTIQLPDYLYN